MAQKVLEVPGVGPVTFAKKKTSRHIRLSVTADGKVRVSMPTWLPYATGLAFAKQKTDWIKSQSTPQVVLQSGMRIGKNHVLRFQESRSGKLTSRSTGSTIMINIPDQLDYQEPEVQNIALKASIRALKSEAENQLPQRLRELADQHGFKVRSIEVKRLRSRWGSCNHQHEIVLNCFLMQLPWELIDYVILHELVHTRIMAHGPRFWAELEQYVPDLTSKRKTIREHRPTVRETFSVSGVA